MGKLWVISDLHLGHRNMEKYCGRPPRFEDIIRENWCQRVASDDTVLNLGDVALGPRADLLQRITDFNSSVPGIKLLLIGNHDHLSHSDYMGAGFALVANHIIIGSIMFTHTLAIPIPDGIEHVIHGHMHNNQEAYADIRSHSAYYKENEHRYHEVHIENGILGPVLLEDFLTQHKLV